MSKILVRKTLKYDPTFGGRFDAYTGYCVITSGEAEVGIEPGQYLRLPETISSVLHSPLLRAKETAQTSGAENLEQVKDLAEVRFELSKLLSREEYLQYGSNLVRERFLNAFEADLLAESRDELHDRVKRVVRLFKSKPDGVYAAVSHSFFMKILQGFFVSGDMFEKPLLLRRYLNPAEKTYNFGEGFDLVL